VGSLSSLRASDADREQTAEQLRHATTEGRLTPDELDERLGALYRSRTYGELDALVADLPVVRAPVAPRRRRPGWLIAAGVGTGLLALVMLLASAARHAVGVAPEGCDFRGTGLPGASAEAHHVVMAAASMLTVLSLLVVFATLMWVVRRSRRLSSRN
jgi:DUF1707 SHOCT-like domain